MLQQRSKLFAGSIERPRLASTWVIAAIAVLILALLTLIFPQRELIKRLVATSEQSELATAYLVNLLRTDPENPELRLVLARQQYRLGRLADAEKTLGTSLSSDQPSVREDAAWLLWVIRVREFERLAEDSPRRSQARSALHLELTRLAGQRWSEAMTLDIARYALALSETELGLHMLSDLAKRRGDLGPDWFNHVARDALGQGQYRVAAELYFFARKRAITLDERRQAYISGLRSLQAGNLVAEALTAGERELDDLGDDKAALYALVELARAANRLDVADKYARRMLRLSLLEQWQQAFVAAGHGSGYVLRVSTTAGDTAQLPFDDQAYRLGYEVFLNNRKPEDAYRVAASAVRQAPHNLAWRERLARGAEWSAKPQVALENWLFLARHDSRDEYWQAVLRLAPGLFDDEALLAALRYQLTKKPDDAKWQAELVDTYERLGRPREGLAYLQQLHTRTGRPELIEAIAGLAERSGDIDAALAAWRLLLAQQTPTPAQAMRAATLMLQSGRSDEAAATLERAHARASDGAYWRLSAELARRQQRDAAALDAYRRLIAGGMAEANDYSAAVALLREDQPQEAAHIAAAGWRKFREPALYLQAMALLSAQGLWREVGDLLGEPDATTVASLERQTDFLRLRAGYFQHVGEPQRARRDLEAALILAPDASGIRQALLWLTIDSNDATALRRLLASRESEWASDPALHDPLAAAWQALSLPQKALDHYLTPHLAEHRGDFLWLMNYADALDQNQETDRAWRLRMELWRDAQQDRGRATPAAESGQQDSARHAAWDRLEITLGGGDRGLAALRELLRLDRNGDDRLTTAAREAKLAWLQGAGEYSAERAYLWHQYARSLSRPLWAEISLALVDDDREALGDLLDRYGERLPSHDRIAAAMRLDDVRRAQGDAFDTATVQTGDDTLQEELGAALLGFSDAARGRAATRQLGSIVEQERGIGLDLAFKPGLSVGLEGSEIKREDQESSGLAGIPASERAVGIHLKLGQADGETRMRAATRDGLRSYHPILIEHEQRLYTRLTLLAGLGRHLPSPESSALLVAGMKDQADLSLSYLIGQRERLSLRWSHERYLGQTGTGLGRSASWQSELSVPLRMETPDLALSGFVSQYGFSREGRSNDAALQALLPAQNSGGVTDFFIPDSFRFYGLRLSSNMRFAGESGEYSRAIRPYAAAAWTHHSEAGAGYDLAVGLAGSVLGTDRLALSWALAKGGNATYSHVRELDLYYRVHF